MKGDETSLYDHKRTVFVGNLPFDVKVICLFGASSFKFMVSQFVSHFSLLFSVVMCWLLFFRTKKFTKFFVVSTIWNPALKVFVSSEIPIIILERVLPMFYSKQEYVTTPTQVTLLSCSHLCIISLCSSVCMQKNHKNI